MIKSTITVWPSYCDRVIYTPKNADFDTLFYGDVSNKVIANSDHNVVLQLNGYQDLLILSITFNVGGLMDSAEFTDRDSWATVVKDIEDVIRRKTRQSLTLDKVDVIHVGLQELKGDAYYFREALQKKGERLTKVVNKAAGSKLAGYETRLFVLYDSRWIAERSTLRRSL